MALCDFLINSDIAGYDCSNPMPKGALATGVIINRSDIDYENSAWDGDFFLSPLKCKCWKAGWRVYQSGKTPFNGTQQEMVEGANANTITNTLQIVVLKQGKEWAEQLFALLNGEFVAVIKNKNGTCQVFGYETGLHCTGAVRELYNDDTLAGWQLTFAEEGATKGNIFISLSNYADLEVLEYCPDDLENAPTNYQRPQAPEGYDGDSLNYESTPAEPLG